jgi:DNA-binding NtrC family response regulator
MFTRHALERAVALSDEPVLTKAAFSLEGSAAPRTPKGSSQATVLPEPAGDAAVLSCLRLHGFDMQATAKTLGWDRSTVTQRLKGLASSPRRIPRRPPRPSGHRRRSDQPENR